MASSSLLYRHVTADRGGSFDTDQLKYNATFLQEQEEL